MSSDPAAVITALSEMDEDENLLWSGKPNGRRILALALFDFLFCVPVVGLAVYWNIILLLSRSEYYGPMIAMFSFYGIPGDGISLVMLVVATNRFLKFRKTVYAVSNKRLLVVVAGGKEPAESLYKSDLEKIGRTEKTNRTGDLSFSKKVTGSVNGYYRKRGIKFIGIPEVRAVEILIRENFGR